MRSKVHKILTFAAVLFSIQRMLVPILSYAQDLSSHPDEIEWTWEVRPTHVDSNLPNVLLVGDSISRNYYPDVQRQLSKEANVYLMATSASVGDPRLPRQLAEFLVMEAISFKVVHVNNGMHGWTYSEADYQAAFPSFLAALHAVAPGSSFIWATTTPVRVDDPTGPTNARINARNRIAQTFIRDADIPIDDQHELMAHHSDQYEDNVHFNSAGAVIQGQQAAQSIRASLQSGNKYRPTSTRPMCCAGSEDAISLQLHGLEAAGHRCDDNEPCSRGLSK